LGEKRSARSLLTHPDCLSGGILMAFAVVALIDAWKLPFGSLRAPDAGFFPISLSALLLLFSGGIICGAFIHDDQSARFSSRSWQVVAGAGAFILYALVLNKAGFVIGTIGVMLLIMRGLGGTSWKQALLVAVPSVGFTYAAFIQLGVPLPRGPLPF
jgi:putative tricarboxylic transport membrane protein